MTYRPTVRGRRLARELRRLREEQRLTLQDVADRLGWSRATVSRLETGQTRPKPGDVADILDLYGVPSPQRDALIALAKQAGQRGWWTAYADVFTGSYVALEDEASRIRSWDSQLIHGLLQTEDYARAVITAGRMLPSQADIDRRIAARKARQALLDRPNAPQLHIALDEAVLHRPIGGPQVMRAQLRKLLELAERPNITLQILPFTAGAHAGLDGRFTILSFPDPDDPDIAYVEGTMGDVYLESTVETEQHGSRFDQIIKASLSPEESAHLLGEAAKE
ncbi:MULTISPECIES: helix-turn-helix domain-containing protein [Thermomonospora]|uniref:Transcriptional regulator, XRE family n=1 Tax=Thermomonospora curvata (strain ATCC 19995 / DSM 43183 / JCM 3096 / KCTC 9072 / NBRC 15933 / NCIMB 10081 / Henssen B9) TaxID=471852 RepID=D1A9J2_THECD|nr:MULTISPECIES: helix-turn-helix transcriptional regulator [Thermomonospora]ACY96888.1 transcriptional regulator, XRE family [Thermomonospora curvata DSM 43183]PKK15174.1 MAG: XRE family transcriptional regulator [Thermomonospora sp. CIF 1]